MHAPLPPAFLPPVTLRLARTFLAVLACLCSWTLTAQAADPTVTTDKADYPPGSTVNISGTGFQAGETVELQVLRIDIDENSGTEHDSWTVPADADGNITTTWYVTEDEAGATLQLTATGLTSGLTAQTTFTDDPHDGKGLMTVLPNTASAGSTGNSFVFSFREDTQNNWPASSVVTISVPTGWTTPQTSNSASAGFVSTTAVGTGHQLTVNSTVVTGSGPWLVTVTFQGGNTGEGFDVTYAGGGTSTKVTAPASIGVNTFTTNSKGGAGGTSGPIASSPQITVNAGSADAAHSTISPATAAITANGSSTQVITVQARDVNNNNLATGGSTVVISKSSGTGTVGSTTDNSNGTYTATVTSPTATGSGTFAATLGGTAVGTAAGASSSVITYAPGAIDHFAITAISSPQTAGTAFSITTITALDANNNTVTGFSSTVTFGGSAGVTGTSATFSSGVLSGASVTPTVAGSNLTVTVNDGSSHTGSATITTVNPGAVNAAHSTISPGTASITADGSSTQVITVQARDLNNNNRTTGGDTVVISKSSGTGTVGSTTNIGNGTYTATVTSPTATGSGTFVATLGGTSVGTAVSASSSVITYTAGPLDHFSVTTPGTQTAGTSFSITTITAQDVNNNTVTSFIGTVDITETGGGAGGTVTGSPSSAFVAGVRSSQSVTLSKSGTGVTLTVTDHAGTGKTGVSGTFTVNAGAATKLAYTTVPSTGTAGTAFSVTVQAQDAGGNPVNLGSATTITLSKASGSGSLSGMLTGSIGSGANNVTISTPIYSKSDTMTLTATASGGVTLTAVTSGSIAFSPGAIDHYVVSASSPQTAGSVFSTTVTAYDANNNTVTTDSSTVVTMSSSTGHAQYDSNGDSTFGDNTKTLSSGTFTISTKDNWVESVNLTATDSNSKTGSASVSTSPVTPSGWYNSAWGYRKALTIDHTKVFGDSGSQTSFPVLISRTDSDLQSHALSSGNDILFTSADGTTKLDHEIEKYTSASGVLLAWVRVPTLSSTADTTLYMYYGNSGAANQQNATSVWDTNFKSVWHLGDSASPANDSTSNGRVATQTGGVTFGATGEIDGAVSMATSANQYLGFTSTASTSTYTASLWLYATSTASAKWSSLLVPSSASGIFFTTNSTVNKISLYYTSDHFNSTALSLNTWYHVAVVNNAGAVTFYLNGNSDGTATGAPAITFATLGGDSSGSFKFGGALDETRISSTARSANWIKTEYYNQSSPSTFYAVGSQQTVTPTALAITSVNGGASPTAGTGFSVVVESQDGAGNARVVQADTAVALTLNTGTGTLGGTTTGTILAGSSSVTISGVTYTKAESGVILTATRTSGDSLTAGNSASFTVNPGAVDHFAISTISSPQTAGTAITGITITVQDANNNTVTSFNGIGNTVTYSGTAGITGTSANFSSGVLSGASVTPSLAGTSMTFIVTGPAGSGSKTGTSTFNVVGNQYAARSFTWDNNSTPAWWSTNGGNSGTYSQNWLPGNSAILEGTAGTVSVAAGGGHDQ